MPLSPTRATIFFRDPAGGLLQACDALRRAGRYSVFSGTIPKGYPLPSPELRELAVCLAVAPGVAAVVPEDPTDVFVWARDLSRHAPQALAIAAKDDFTGAFCCKVWAAGHPIAKFGADADHELFYAVPEAGAPQLTELERRLGLSMTQQPHFKALSADWQAKAPLGLDDVLRGMALPRALPFAAAKQDTALPWQVWTWVRQGSRLLDG
jgi:hypothetical protein